MYGFVHKQWSYRHIYATKFVFQNAIVMERLLTETNRTRIGFAQLTVFFFFLEGAIDKRLSIAISRRNCY